MERKGGQIVVCVCVCAFVYVCVCSCSVCVCVCCLSMPLFVVYCGGLIGIGMAYLDYDNQDTVFFSMSRLNL